MIKFLFQSIFLDANLKIPHPVIQTNSVYFLKNSLREGDRVTYIPPSIVFKELKRGEFVILPTKMPTKKTKAGIIYRANDILPAAAVEVIDGLKRKRKDLHVL